VTVFFEAADASWRGGLVSIATGSATPTGWLCGGCVVAVAVARSTATRAKLPMVAAPDRHLPLPAADKPGMVAVEERVTATVVSV
jgi:hypothetical protein